MRNGRQRRGPILPSIPREWTFYAALVLAVGWLITQLYRVQVSEFSGYQEQAVENRTRLISEPAPRGFAMRPDHSGDEKPMRRRGAY